MHSMWVRVKLRTCCYFILFFFKHFISLNPYNHFVRSRLKASDAESGIFPHGVFRNLPFRSDRCSPQRMCVHIFASFRWKSILCTASPVHVKFRYINTVISYTFKFPRTWWRRWGCICVRVCLCVRWSVSKIDNKVQIVKYFRSGSSPPVDAAVVVVAAAPSHKSYYLCACHWELSLSDKHITKVSGRLCANAELDRFSKILSQLQN